MKQYPVPTSKKEVRAFLGLAGYYRQFVPQFATIAIPLMDLTQKKVPDKVLWSDQCEAAFQALKKALTEHPILLVADPTKPFTLQTDASHYGLGAVVSQQGEDNCEHPVAYASRCLLPCEVKYAVVEKECLAIVWALDHFNVYLCGQDFTVMTDHKPLAWLQKMKDSNAHLLRWSLQIQSYRFELKYRRGSQHTNADGLSHGGMEMTPMSSQSPRRHLEGEVM